MDLQALRFFSCPAACTWKQAHAVELSQNAGPTSFTPARLMPPRFHVPVPLLPMATLDLPAGPARHAQVLRLQPGDPVILFSGEGGEWHAEVTRMGRSDVQVRLQEHRAVDRELAAQVTLALGVPANERMDMVVEKATELGVTAIQPLMCERSVLRMHGERADKKLAHWQAVASSASEQCGRTRVPAVLPVASLTEWLRALPADAQDERRCMLSLRNAPPWNPVQHAIGRTLFLSGPEGGLTEPEESAARACGFAAVSLGPRVLRADTAPLAALAALALAASGIDG
jgi:16S rRNA (uracil1498-N3)-methyltransferase